MTWDDNWFPTDAEWTRACRRLIQSWLRAKPLSVELRPYYRVETDGVSFLDGECLATRLDTSDAPAVLLNKKRYAIRYGIGRLRLALVPELEAAGIVVHPVHPPRYTQYVERNDLLRGWLNGLEEIGVSPKTRGLPGVGDDYYSWAASRLIDAWAQEGRVSCDRGSRRAEYDGESLYAYNECILTSVKGRRIAILNGRKYRRTSHNFALREALRAELVRRKLAFAEIHPGPSYHYTAPWNLTDAWEHQPGKLALA